jgi:hypothetical protein
MIKHAKLLLIASVGVLFAYAASAETPVAIVEEISGSPAGIEFMDYVYAGKVVRLGSHDSIVLSYLDSCWREKITGGTITIGSEQSLVEGGKVERTKIVCDAGKMLLTAELAGKNAAMVFRAPQRPEFTLYGLSPIVEVNPGSTLLIERLDQSGERYEVVITDKQLQHGTFYDLAKAHESLTAGGIYRASAGTQQLVFKIDANAKPGMAPIAGRLLRLQPAN